MDKSGSKFYICVHLRNVGSIIIVDFSGIKDTTYLKKTLSNWNLQRRVKTKN